MGIEYDNARDDTLRELFSCGSTNILGGFGASNLAALGVGWLLWGSRASNLVAHR